VDTGRVGSAAAVPRARADPTCDERFAAVLFPDPVVYVDNRLADDDGGRAISGRICVFTERFLGVADLAGVASMTGIVGRPDQGTTVVSFVSRSTLVRIDMVPGDGYANSGAAWAADEARGGWPYAGEVSLCTTACPAPSCSRRPTPSPSTDSFRRSWTTSPGSSERPLVRPPLTNRARLRRPPRRPLMPRVARLARTASRTPIHDRSSRRLRVRPVVVDRS